MVMLRKGRASPPTTSAQMAAPGYTGLSSTDESLAGFLYFTRVFAILSFSLPIGGSQSPEILPDLPNLSLSHKNPRAGRRCKREERGDRKWSVTL